MKKPPILLCFVVFTSLFQPHASAIDEVQCTGVKDSGVCGKGSKKFAESVCEATRPVQPSDYNNIADTKEECQKRFSGTPSSLSNEFGLKAKFIPYAYDPFFFQLELDWEDHPYAQGYYVVITPLIQGDTSTTVPKDFAYKCIEGGSNSNVTILLEYSFPRALSHCNGPKREFQFTVYGMPINKYSSHWRAKRTWPNNCFDIANESLCGPKTPSGSVISIQTDLLPNETSLMSATVTWSNPLNTIYNITDYNLLLFWNNKHGSFHFNQTSADLRSVTFKPLSITSEYYFVLEPFQKKVCQYQCSLGSPKPGHYGSLVHKLFSYIPPPSPSPSPSPSLLPSFSSVSPSPTAHSTLTISSSYHLSDLVHSTPSIALSTSPAYSVDTNGTIAIGESTHDSIFHNYYKEIVGGIAVVIFAVVVFGFIVLAIVIKQKRDDTRRGCDQGEDILNSPDQSGQSSVSTTRSSTPSSPLSPVSVLTQDIFFYDEEPYCSSASVLPSYYKRPPYLHPGVNLVLVIESHNSPGKDIDINQSFLGSVLNEYKDLHVLHYNAVSKLTPAQWLMDNMGDASVVICVCNKEFQEEWEGIKNKDGSLVNPLRNYVIGSSNQGDSLADKYVTVTHTLEDKRYIPREFHVVKHCLINQTKDLYCIITQTPNRIVK